MTRAAVGALRLIDSSYSRAQNVMGGTSQIQRNIIATTILALPTE